MTKLLKANIHQLLFFGRMRSLRGAIQFKEGKWGCVAAVLFKVAQGNIAVFDEKTTGCRGGAVGLGFNSFELGYIEYFLSTGLPERNIPGEFHRKNPEMAKGFTTQLPKIQIPTNYVVFKPLNQVTEGEHPQCIVFFVNPDQLSACVMFANYDRPTKDNAILYSAAGCHQTILETIAQNNSDDPKAIRYFSEAFYRQRLINV